MEKNYETELSNFFIHEAYWSSYKKQCRFPAIRYLQCQGYLHLMMKQKPFLPFYEELNIPAAQNNIYDAIERKGWKDNEFDIEAIIQSGDPLMISFRSTRSEMGNQFSHLNPTLYANYNEEGDNETRIRVEIRSAIMVWIFAGLLSVAIIFNALKGILANWPNILLFSVLLVALTFIDIYLRAALLIRFKKWMNIASLGRV